ncbi:hypothetical protein [Variovorax sp. GT1P44]|uniref:hypothetical protein n=1 Tax=Variovorax sp. GT1P44 TaxID=3443742 RepID=UPI003F488D22
MAAVMAQEDELVTAQPTMDDEEDQDVFLAAVQWLCAHHGVPLSEPALQAGIDAGWVSRDVGGLLSYLYGGQALLANPRDASCCPDGPQRYRIELSAVVEGHNPRPLSNGPATGF